MRERVGMQWYQAEKRVSGADECVWVREFVILL